MSRLEVAYGPLRTSDGRLVGSGRTFDGYGSLKFLWETAVRRERERAAGLPVPVVFVSWEYRTLHERLPYCGPCDSFDCACLVDREVVA